MNAKDKTRRRRIRSMLLAVLLVASFSAVGVLAAIWYTTGPSMALDPPTPGQWVSIGPDYVYGPPLPANADHTALGAYNAVGRLTTMAIHPTNPQIIYVGSPGELGQEGCGIWKTMDGGQTWQPVGDSLPTLAVAAIAIDPSDTDRVYIATADKGIFRSDDAGGHWVNLSAPLRVRTNTTDGDRTALLINPAHTNVLYLTTDNGVLRSSDGGQTWPVSLDAGAATNLVMDPLDPNVLYAGILGAGVYKTTNGGANGSGDWSLQNQAPLPSVVPAWRGPLLAISHPVSEAQETVYAMYPTNSVLPGKNGYGWDLFRTTDGTSWASLRSCSGGETGCLFFVISADPVNSNRVFIGGPLLYTAEIGVTQFGDPVPPPASDGKQWNDRQPASPHGDYWELAFDPTSSQNVFAASDGGIFRSTNHGLKGSWSFIGEGITNAEMYDIAQAETQPGRLIAATQDNGNILYSGSMVWDHIPPDQIFGGDGAMAAIDPTDADTLYAMGQLQDSLSQSKDGGQSFQPFAGGLPISDAKKTATPVGCAAYNSTFFLQVHPTVPTTLLASCVSLYRTTTNASPGNWSPFFTPPAGTGIAVHSAIDPDSDLYYVGTGSDLAHFNPSQAVKGSGHVFAVPADGSPAQDIFSHPNGQDVSDIEVDPARPDTVYTSFAPQYTVNRPCPATAGQVRIYKFTRQSSIDLVYSSTDITGNLRDTDLCVNSVAVDPNIPRTLYAGTNRGVYRGRSNASGGPWVWEAYNEGMPLADVRDLEVHPVTGVIDAATYGRSAFELVPETILPILIDIKPGGTPNSINPKSKGKIPVAILSSITFDAPSEIDASSLTFGRTGNETSLAFCNTDPSDVNGDGLLDLVCHFKTKVAGFQSGDTQGILEGKTIDGIQIQGTDTVRTVP